MMRSKVCSLFVFSLAAADKRRYSHGGGVEGSVVAQCSDDQSRDSPGQCWSLYSGER